MTAAACEAVLPGITVAHAAIRQVTAPREGKRTAAKLVTTPAATEAQHLGTAGVKDGAALVKSP